MSGPSEVRRMHLLAVHGDRREELGACSCVVAAKRRSRIEYRSGRRCHYLLIDDDTGRAVEEWEVVGRADRAGGPDCVKLWPPDPDEPEGPAAIVPAAVLRRMRSRAA
jgi:hypothetical protein